MKICPKCGNLKITGVEYGYGNPNRYDGISEWWCAPHNDGCGYRQGRWTGFELHEGEAEPRYGQVRTHVGGGKYEMRDASAPVKVGV